MPPSALLFLEDELFAHKRLTLIPMPNNKTPYQAALQSKLATYVDEGLLPPLDFRYHKPGQDGMGSLMSDLGDQGYNIHRDPQFLQRLDSNDWMRMGGQGLGLAAGIGGAAKTMYNLGKHGRPGWISPLMALAGVGLADFSTPE